MLRQRLLLPLLAAAAVLAAQDSISGERIRAHIRFLASDLLEGRGVGTRGGELAVGPETAVINQQYPAFPWH